MGSRIAPFAALAGFAIPMLGGNAQIPASSPSRNEAGGPITTRSGAVVITASDVATTIRRLSAKFTDDEPLRVLEASPNRLGAFVVGRPKKTGPQQRAQGGAVRVTEGLQLDQVSAVLRVLDGVGTFVSGGTLVSPQRMHADDPDATVIGPGSRGKAILGGHSQRISAGDMVIVPAGVPHGFSEIDSPMTYLVIRVDSGRALPLK